MEESQKRKGAPGSSDPNPAKKKKGGNQGKWQTPHHKSKEPRRDDILPGDVGVWVSCARSQETKAAHEVQLLFDEYVEKIYNIQPLGEETRSGDEDVEEDIEASIEKELTSMKPGNAARASRLFTVIRQSVDCLLFVKIREPMEPVELVRRICEDASVASRPQDRRSRYLNRFTPITLIGRATEKGVSELCEKVLPRCFKLKSNLGAAGSEDSEGGCDKTETDKPDAEANGDGVEGKADGKSLDKESEPAYSYAIRLATRNRCPLKRDDVIKQIASMIDGRHQVNLGTPDKVILVDMYQTICGMSVVDGDWEKLKRYNITELYSHAPTRASRDTTETTTGGGPVEGQKRGE